MKKNHDWKIQEYDPKKSYEEWRNQYFKDAGWTPPSRQVRLNNANYPQISPIVDIIIHVIVGTIALGIFLYFAQEDSTKVEEDSGQSYLYEPERENITTEELDSIQEYVKQN